MADIQLPDGNFVRVPDFALESTSKQMLKIMEAQLGSNKKALAIYEDLLEEAEAEAKRDIEDSEKTKQHRREQAQNFRDLIKVTGKKGFAKQFSKNFTSATLGLTGGLLKLSKVAGIHAVAALGALTKSALNVGNTLADLTQVGVGFTDAGGSAVDALGNIRALGVSAKDAAGLLAGYSNVVQTVGKNTFVQLQKEFATATGFGSDFGMTMQEASDIIAEDLDRRQKLGILADLDANRAAKRSSELYQQQLEATTILGKSIDDIRGASQATLTDNAQAALRIQSIAAGLDPEAARDFVRGMERALGDLAAVGLDQGLINTIGAAATELVAFGSDATGELFGAVAVLDSKAGTAITETIRAANELSKTDPDAAQRMLNNLDEEFRDAAMSLNSTDFRELQGTLAMQGAAGEALALSLAQLRTAAQNLEKPLDVAGKQFPGLARGAAAFDQAVAQITGSVGSLITGITGTFGDEMSALADAFTKTSETTEDLPGVLSVLMDSVSAIGTALKNLLNPLGATGDQARSLSDRIREFANNGLKTFTDNVVSFIEGIDVEATKKKFGDFIEGLGIAYNAVKSLGEGIMRFLGFFIDTEKVTDDEGNTKTKFTGFNWGKIALGVLGVISIKALLATAMPMVGSWMLQKIPGFGGAKGAVGNAVDSITGGASKSAGRGMGGMLRGMGAGLRGMAGGLAAFANPATLIGLAAVTAAIIGIGFAVRIAAPAIEAFGEAFKSVLEGLAPVVESTGSAIKSILEGIGNVIGSVGDAIKSVFEGVGSYVESIGTSIATVAEGIANAVTQIRTAGAEAAAIKLGAQADVVERLSLIPTERITAIADAIKDVTSSLAGFSSTVGKDGMFGDRGADLDKQNQQLDILGRLGSLNAEGITAVAVSMDKIAAVYKKFAELDSDALFNSARAIDAVNRAVEPDEEAVAERIGRGLMRAGQQVLEYGATLVGGGNQAPAPEPQADETAQTTPESTQAAQSTADKTQHDLLASIAISAEKTNKLMRELTDTVRDS